MGGKYGKPVKKDDPSLNLEGGSPAKYLKLLNISSYRYLFAFLK